jgi:hypothetical protein
MRTKVAARRIGDRYVIRFTEAQRSLTNSIGLFVRDRADPVDSILRFGVDSAAASKIMEKTRADDAKFTLDELHVLFSALVGVAAMIPTEEEFYSRIGFFREQAMDLADALANSISNAEPIEDGAGQRDQRR